MDRIMETCRLPAQQQPPTSTISTSGNTSKDDGLKAFLPPGFSSMEEYLVCLKAFLAGCEPVTDLMIVDYFTTNSWETRMPQSWREAFECPQGKLSSLDLMRLVSLGHLRDFKEPAAGAPLEQQLVMEEECGVQDWPESLKDFVRMVKALSINRTLDPDYAKFKDTLDIHLIPGMSPKKLHEVEILSGLMASTAKEHSIGSVIDLGAGQGYLSRVLAFQHQLCVLGVDSNTIQTCGAQTTQKRTEKLFVNKSKLKNASGKGRNSRPTAKQQQQQNRRSATSASAPATPPVPAETEARTEAVSGIESTGAALTTTTTTVATETTATTPTLNASTETAEVCPKSRTAGMRSRSSSPTGSSGSAGPCKRSSRTKKPKVKKNRAAAEIIIPSSGATGCGSLATMTTTTKSPINGTLDGNNDTAKPTTTAANDPSLATTPGSNFQLQHITHHITAATLPTLLKEHFPRKPKPQQDAAAENINGEAAIQECPDEDVEGRWTLCGLHACGDLTSNMIKLYLESSATCLFSVGCCYHWITERYDKAGNIAISDGSHGFPLSAAFNRHKCHLGEHAKMIACQSPERWLEYQKETEDAIHGHYFRALLHKLMVERGLYPGPPAVAPVLGRMGKHRLKGFPHYLATAVSRLCLPTDKITPEEAQAAYDEFLDRDLYRIGILWALRTMLGPLFEGMILLDRATYLHENIIGDGDESGDKKATGKKASVQLIAGFDVVESPRNMILVALKD
ncbi:Methyltransferase-like protein 25 [Linnemannia schmuckeri]|uniref:Methyltransferase-like protein 25 n=1 Tax=Linnemannia schmuckeri TaxID=64567 RepID=A0A9P5V6F1_9FUNG|nr:Methyltransferase-like protein 25 [Linnemannia schmuckeri]